jgi:hypothetical protein
MESVLSQRKDNTALIDRLLKEEDNLLDNKDDMQSVEGFFKNQVQIFDAATQMEEDLRNDLDYLSHEPEANDALNHIRLITVVDSGFSYKKIPELNGLMATVHAGHERLLAAKREELEDIVTQCMGAIHQAADGNYDVKNIITKAEGYYDQKRQQILDYAILALLDGLVPPMLQYKDNTCNSIESMLKPSVEKPPVSPKPVDGGTVTSSQSKKVIKAYQRGIVFPAKTLETEAEIDAYVEQMRQQLKTLLKGCDGIQLK